jgi:hypothetical protein
MRPFNGSSNLNTIDGSGSLKGSAIGSEVCTVADGDPNMDLELFRQFAPENGISTKYLLTGQRKRAEPYQSILLQQDGPVVQPSGTYTVVNTSAFGSGEPTLHNLEYGQGSIPGYKSRFPQLLSKPSPDQMVPKNSGGELRGIDVNDFDTKDPVSGASIKEKPSILSPQAELNDRLDLAMKAYTSENNIDALSLPFRASNWAAENGLVPDNQGSIPVYSPDGKVISNLKAPEGAPKPLPPLTTKQRQALGGKQTRQIPTINVHEKKDTPHESKAHTAHKNVPQKQERKKLSKMGYIFLIACAVILLVLIVLLIVFSSSSKKEKAEETTTSFSPRPMTRSMSFEKRSEVFDETSYY